MRYDNLADLEPQALAPRRRLADTRQARDRERKALLARVVRMSRRAAAPGEWIDFHKGNETAEQFPGLQRMIAWAKAELGELETFISPSELSATLHNQNLFPEVDELHDPRGEQPRRQPWGRWSSSRGTRPLSCRALSNGWSASGRASSRCSSLSFH